MKVSQLQVNVRVHKDNQLSKGQSQPAGGQIHQAGGHSKLDEVQSHQDGGHNQLGKDQSPQDGGHSQLDEGQSHPDGGHSPQSKIRVIQMEIIVI